MSDEEKKKNVLELAAEKGLSKFKTEEDLINSYLELEKRHSSHKPNKDTSDEDLIRQTADFYKNSHDGENILKGKLGDMEKKLVKEKGLHPKIAAAAVAEVAGQVAMDIQGGNKKTVTQILKDPVKRAAIESALSEAGSFDDFQSAYDKGLITPQEALLWAKLGDSKKSAPASQQDVGDSGVERGVNFDGTSSGELQKQWDEIILNLKSPYYSAKHPEYSSSRKKIAEIEKLLQKRG